MKGNKTCLVGFDLSGCDDKQVRFATDPPDLYVHREASHWGHHGE